MNEDPGDWIRLDTGEWLAGRFIKMDHTTVYFESDKLDVLTFDWTTSPSSRP